MPPELSEIKKAVLKKDPAYQQFVQDLQDAMAPTITVLKINTGLRRCNICLQVKDLSDFPKVNTGKIRYYCNDCDELHNANKTICMNFTPRTARIILGGLYKMIEEVTDKNKNEQKLIQQQIHRLENKL